MRTNRSVSPEIVWAYAEARKSEMTERNMVYDVAGPFYYRKLSLAIGDTPAQPAPPRQREDYAESSTAPSSPTENPLCSHKFQTTS
ncbi:hypothetical protein BDZ89DRAFT_1070807 [Hymenopellis radicata]|nr:hypothetical protein BDZ89DRAFT_1070807 [Hymenopellis radicata]